MKDGSGRNTVRILRYVVILCALGVAVLAILTFGRTGIITRVTEIRMKDIGELATQAGYFTTVQSIHKSREVLGFEVPGTQSNYVYSYDGTIKAGIDFGEVDVEVDEIRHVIVVSLPEVRILSTEIDEDSFVLYNDGQNLFTSLKLEDVDKSNTELKKAARETAIRNGLLENARSNAELLIRGFLSASYDLTQYQVAFADKKPQDEKK